MTFSNISSEMPPEETGSEVQESVESPKVQEEATQLEQATFEPEAVVELDISHQDAEIVEAAFTETMQTAEAPASKVARPDPSGDGTTAIIDTNDRPRAASEEVSATPITIPEELPPTQDKVSATPITLPGQAREGGQGGRPGSGVEATPINLPNQQDEVSATPITLPGQARESGQGGRPGSGVEATPINLPNPQDEVSATPIPLPTDPPVEIIDSNDHPRSASDEISATPITLPGQAREGGDPAAIIDSNDSPRLGDDRVMIDTVPLPEKPESISSQNAKDGRVAIGTWPTPDEEMEIAQKANPSVLDARTGDERVKIDTVPLPEEPGIKAVSLDGKGADTAAGLDDGTVDQFFDPDRVSEDGGPRDGMSNDDMLDVHGQDVGKISDPVSGLELPDGNGGMGGGREDDLLAGLDPMGGGGPGKDILPDGSLGGPDIGLDPADELAGLASAAAPGPDSFISEQAGSPKKTTGNNNNNNNNNNSSNSNNSGSNSNNNSSSTDGNNSGGTNSGGTDSGGTDTGGTDSGGTDTGGNDSGGNDSGGSGDSGGSKPGDTGDKGKRVSPPITVKNTVGNMMSNIQDIMGSDGGGADKAVSNSTVGVRGTPTPDGDFGTGTTPTEHDAAEAYLASLIGLDDHDELPVDQGESMMQPVGDEEQGKERPVMKMSASELRKAQLDPYIQNSGEETSGGVIDIRDLDADGNLIDPPGGMSAGGDGVMMSDDQNANNDELDASSTENMEPTDGKI